MTIWKHKPVVWVSGPDKGGTAAWLATRFAVRRSGGKPMRVTPSNVGKVVRKTQRRTGEDAPRALILGGGADIDPVHYQDLITDLRNIRTTPDPKEPSGQRIWTLFLAPFFGLLRKLFSAGPIAVDQARDDLEWRLLKDAIRAGIPVLGICRGAQLINVFHKGTLYQDLATYYRERPTITTIYPRKEVRLDPESRLYGIFGEEAIRVNSLHNQAVKDTGDGIVVVARETTGGTAREDAAVKSSDDTDAPEGATADASPDRQGVAQAIERRDYDFMIGVQWHPEYLPQVPSQRRLFDELVRCAILHRDGPAQQGSGHLAGNEHAGKDGNRSKPKK